MFTFPPGKCGVISVSVLCWQEDGVLQFACDRRPALVRREGALADNYGAGWLWCALSETFACAWEEQQGGLCMALS